MKVVTIIQAKGGAGKTTLAMALATGAVSLGMRVHLLDGDNNPQLAEWRNRVAHADWDHIEKPDWPENLTSALAPVTRDDLYEVLDSLEESGVELTIIDTRPGTHVDTEVLVDAADLVLIPTVPNQMDYPLAQDAYVWMMKQKATYEDPSEFADVRIVVSNASTEIVRAAMGISTDGVTNKEYTILEAISQMASLNTIIPNSKIWVHAPIYGPLSVAATAHRALAKNMNAQVKVGENLVKEVMKIGEG